MEEGREGWRKGRKGDDEANQTAGGEGWKAGLQTIIYSTIPGFKTLTWGILQVMGEQMTTLHDLTTLKRQHNFEDNTFTPSKKQQFLVKVFGEFKLLAAKFEPWKW